MQNHRQGNISKVKRNLVEAADALRAMGPPGGGSDIPRNITALVTDHSRLESDIRERAVYDVLDGKAKAIWDPTGLLAAYDDERSGLKAPLQEEKSQQYIVTDLFAPEVPDSLIAEAFGVMAASNRHLFLLVTEYPGRALSILGAGCMGRFDDDVAACAGKYGAPQPNLPLANLWMGVHITTAAEAEERIRTLVDVPAAKRWVAIRQRPEEDISLRKWLKQGNGDEVVSWVIAALGSATGESTVRLAHECLSAGAKFTMVLPESWIWPLPIDRKRGIASGATMRLNHAALA